MRDVRAGAGEKIVDAQHFIPLFEEFFAKMATNKACAAGHQDTVDEVHNECLRSRANQGSAAALACYIPTAQRKAILPDGRSALRR